MTTLSSAVLDALPVPVPTYDRGSLTPGIVHIGVGGFHRAHQAMYLDRLLAEDKAREWAICGVGVLPVDRRIIDTLNQQDGLYTLAVKHADGRVDFRVIGSIVDALLAPDDPDAVVERMAAPTTRIVSLTVTEGGYNFSAITGEFDLDDPGVRADLEPGAVPGTTFGLVVEALRRRRDRGMPAFTVVSCDNIQGNGEVARRSFTTYARLKDPELAAWIEEQVRFPSSMVDRITPGTTDADRAMVSEALGVTDGWPVVCEPFTQWVLEDDFVGGPDGRPPLEDAGVQLVADVEPYELMKLRLLNAGHQALAYLGHLLGHQYVHDAAQDRELADFVRGYMDAEGTPTLAPVPGIDLTAYKAELLERFANPAVADTVARLCADSSNRIPKWLLPVVRENLRTGGPVDRAATVVAAWTRYAEGTDERGQPIEVVDRLAERLVPLAQRSREEPLAFLSDREVFGDLADDDRFSRAYLAALRSLRERGARATLQAAGGAEPAR